jgi:transcriptional regulator with XRE-family HTH domain
MDGKQFLKLLDESETIKRLLILNTLRSGSSQAEVAKALGITDRQIRNILAGKG